MDEQEYVYQWRPLIIPGGIYLVSFPILAAILWFFVKIPSAELITLSILYSLTLIGIVTLWIYGWSKRLNIGENQLVLNNILGRKVLTSAEIRRIALFTTKAGKEVVQIKTKNKDYYLTDLYFPFPELMTDLEQFVRINSIRTNL